MKKLLLVVMIIGCCTAQPGYFRPSSNQGFIEDLSTSYAWPAYPMGFCYDGVENIGAYYTSQGYNVQYALNRDMSHTWLMVEDSRGYYAAVDSYRGYVPINQCHEYYAPYYSFSSFSEMSEALPRWPV